MAKEEALTEDEKTQCAYILSSPDTALLRGMYQGKPVAIIVDVSIDDDDVYWCLSPLAILVNEDMLTELTCDGETVGSDAMIGKACDLYRNHLGICMHGGHDHDDHWLGNEITWPCENCGGTVFCADPIDGLLSHGDPHTGCDDPSYFKANVTA